MAFRVSLWARINVDLVDTLNTSKAPANRFEEVR